MVISLTVAQANTLEYLGRDIKLNENNDISFGSVNDVTTILYYDNLKQAIKNRLLTTTNELTNHPLYGCLLSDQVSASLTDNSLNIIKDIVRDALLQEPRIEQIVKINVYIKNNIITVEIEVKPLLQQNTLNLIYNLFQ